MDVGVERTLSPGSRWMIFGLRRAKTLC